MNTLCCTDVLSVWLLVPCLKSHHEQRPSFAKSQCEACCSLWRPSTDGHDEGGVLKVSLERRVLGADEADPMLTSAQQADK